MKLTRTPEEDEGDVTTVWIVTYSDMVTLLLTFFLLLYSFTQLGEKEQGALVQALHEVDEGGEAGGGARPSEELEGAARDLAARFGTAPGGEGAWVEVTEGEVTVGLPSGITFATGDATLTPEATRILAEVGRRLAALPNAIRVEGHTDDQPIRGGRELSSNWDLSAARAQSVVAVLVAGGVDARRLQVVGYADARPRRPNDSEEGRRANRRIELKLVRSDR